jgi:hypothetical protein
MNDGLLGRDLYSQLYRFTETDVEMYDDLLGRDLYGQLYRMNDDLLGRDLYSQLYRFTETVSHLDIHRFYALYIHTAEDLHKTKCSTLKKNS